MAEFDLINQYFKSATVQRGDVELGIGDDCAILSPPAGYQLALTTDTLLSGVHFPGNTAAADIGYKSLAANLSDLAAMGATPAWASLAISLPEIDETWITGFMQGFTSLAEGYDLALVGGDTTQGPLSITLQLIGLVKPDKTLQRDRARPGDAIFVTGTLGDAGLGLKAVLENLPLNHDLDYCVQRLNRPQPRVEAGQLLSEYCQCAIDISDGLLADLGHICEASQLGAQIKLDAIPLSAALNRQYGANIDWQSVLSSGDDFELCFCCNDQNTEALSQACQQRDIHISHIGYMRSTPGVEVLDASGQPMPFTQSGYQHFSA